jgi:predicted DNA-binding protein (MmcQ/YjbR family)
MPADPLPKLRSLCLAFPASSEKEAWGEPTFRAKDKLFAMYASASNHHGGGRPAVWIKAKPENQALVIADDPDRYFKPPYVGPSGWIGVWLDRRPPWKAIASLLDDGFRQVAPRKVLALLDGDGPDAPARRTRG